MKKRNVIDPFTRRSFFGSLGKGLTSIAALPQIFFPTKVSAATNHPDPLSDVEDWFKKIKGTHRIEYDAPSIHEGFPIIWSWMEGQPTYDLIGDSNGSRRAGYTISAEPGVNYKIKKTTCYLFVPLTLQRKTQQTVPDIARSTITGTYFISGGRFADYMVFLGAVFRL